MADKNTPDYWIDLSERRLKDVKDWRSMKIEKQWTINWAWYKGQHNLKYDTQAKRLVWDEDDPLKFYVNLIYSTVRAVVAASTKDQPEWEVDARPYGTLKEEQTRALSYFLEGEWQRMEMKSKVKDLLKYGLIYGMGVFEYGFDADDEDGQLWVKTLDPFDTYIDPLTTDRELKDCRYVIKTVRRSLDSIRANEEYDNTDKISPDNAVAESEWKRKAVLQDFGTETMGSQKSTESVILKESYFREKDGIRIVTTAGGRLLRNESPKETGLKEFPFCVYFADYNPGQIYSEGWVKNLVPINRAINAIERSILEFNTIMSKGKYITDTRSNVKMITNDNGVIVRKSPGSLFEQMKIEPMSSTPFNQLENLKEYMKEVGASNEAFMGATPTGIKAARAIELLVANNMNNLADLIDNLEIVLQNLGTKLLEVGYDKFVTSKEFKVKTQGSEVKIGKIIGGKYKAGPNTIQIPKRPEVRVRVISGVIHTKEARIDMYNTLRLQGDLDRRTLLEEMELPADEIELRLEEENQGMPISSDAEEAAMQKEKDIEAQLAAERMMPQDVAMQDVGVPPVDYGVPEGMAL